MKKKLAFIGASATAFLLPAVTFAQNAAVSCANNIYAKGIEDVICRIYRIIKIIIPVLILGAVAWFIWGIIQFLTAHDAEEKGDARGMMIHGIIAFAVILGLWGLVNILLSTFGLEGSNVGGPGALPTF